MTNIAMDNPLLMEVLMGKSSINGPFSRAMLMIFSDGLVGALNQL